MLEVAFPISFANDVHVAQESNLAHPTLELRLRVVFWCRKTDEAMATVKNNLFFPLNIDNFVAIEF